MVCKIGLWYRPLLGTIILYRLLGMPQINLNSCSKNLLTETVNNMESIIQNHMVDFIIYEVWGNLVWSILIWLLYNMIVEVSNNAK